MDAENVLLFGYSPDSLREFKRDTQVVSDDSMKGIFKVSGQHRGGDAFDCAIGGDEIKMVVVREQDCSSALNRRIEMSFP